MNIPHLIRDFLKNEKLTVGLKTIGIFSISAGIYAFILDQIAFAISPEYLEALKLLYSKVPGVPCTWLQVCLIDFGFAVSKTLWLGVILGAFGFWIQTERSYFHIKLKSILAFFGTMAISGVLTYFITQAILPNYLDSFHTLLSYQFEMIATINDRKTIFKLVSVFILVFFQILSLFPSLLVSCFYQYRALHKTS